MYYLCSIIQFSKQLIFYKMKNIIKRNLPLDTKYVVLDKKYIPLIEGVGCVCDNCNKLIANIATVKNESGKVFNIGFDCLETLLINNQLLSEFDIQEYERIKKLIPKILRLAKEIKEVEKLNNGLTGLRFEPYKYKSDFIPFYYIKGNAKPLNSYTKIKDKDCDINFLITTLKNIFPKLHIELIN